MKGSPPLDGSTLLALFRLFAPEPGSHYYVTLRAHAPGPGGTGVRHSVELRRGLVWPFGEPVLYVVSETLDASGAVTLAVVEDGARRALHHDAPADDVEALVAAAVAVVSRWLGVPPGEIRPADHLDHGEEGSLAVEAAVRERSEALHRRFATGSTPLAGPSPHVPVIAAGASPGPTASSAPAAARETGWLQRLLGWFRERLG